MKYDKLICVVLGAVLAPGVAAQMRGGGFRPGFAGLGRGTGFAGHAGQGFGRNPVFFGDPFLYADYTSGSLPPEIASRPVFVLQAPSPVAAAPEPPREPLLIELQGDRYVRFGDNQQVEATGDSPGSARLRSARVPASSSPGPAISALELPPAVLIFRDGHQEQVRDYVIAGGVLYASGNYWQSGSWRKDVQLSALDIPATLNANQNHGVKFVLPSGPNEVVTRP
ncbi:MAG: hypothetical protein WB952_09915 [Terriglobales bacterium]